MSAEELYPVYDEEGIETPYVIDELTEPYFKAYVLIDGEPHQIARIKKWNNNVAPYEDLDTGMMYDSIDYLCGKVTDYEYEQY